MPHCSVTILKRLRAPANDDSAFCLCLITCSSLFIQNFLRLCETSKSIQNLSEILWEVWIHSKLFKNFMIGLNLTIKSIFWYTIGRMTIFFI
jgi:hypothetical protein